MAKKNDEMALDRAQNLVWEACETSSKTKKLDLARQALSISEDCADAYVVLAEESGLSVQKRIELLEKGYKAGHRALGPSYFKDDVGSFWGLVETRPYMRARFGLAVELKIAGRMDEAVVHFEEVLRLNGHSDNLGTRYLLAPYYVAQGKLKEAAKLIQRYPDDIDPNLNYSHALLLFKQEGDSKAARTALQEAARWNPHVLSYLLTPKLGRRRFNESYGIVCGSREEAYCYAKHWRKSRHETKGAINWLIKNLLAGWIAQNNLYISDKKTVLDLEQSDY